MTSRTSTILAATILVAVAVVSTAGFAARTSAEAPAPSPRSPEMTVDWRDDLASDADFEPLLAKARAERSARALVGLQVLWSADALLTAAERTRQEGEIATIREALLETMRAGTYRVVRTYDRLPLVAVELSVEGLESLRRGARAAKLREDEEHTLSLGTTTKVVEAAETTALGFVGAGERIAILDSGVDASHPFLGGRVDTAASACFSSNDCTGGTVVNPAFAFGPGAAEPCSFTPQSQKCEHGTIVAGIAAGANGTDGISGVAPGATIVPIKVTSKTGFDPAQCPGDSQCLRVRGSDAIAGLDYVHNLGDVDVINMSFGKGFHPSPCGSPFYSVAVAQLVGDGTSIVASSGNSGASLPFGKSGIEAPACVAGVISVGRTDDNDLVDAGSQSTPGLSLLAPGTDVVSSSAGAFGEFDGTSVAAPHVAGALAVLGAQEPTATPAELLAALQTTGMPVTDPANGVTTPRLRLLNALVSFEETGFDNVYSDLLKGGRIVSNGASGQNLPTTLDFSTQFQPGSTIKAAHVFFMTAGGADADTSVEINGSTIPAQLIGASRAPCGVAGGGAVRVYRADLPVAVGASYSIDGVSPGGLGVSLVFVTARESEPTRRVVIRAGAMTALQGESMSHTFNPVFPPLRAVELHVGMGHGDKAIEHPMKLGGLSAFPAGTFDGSDGGDWDDETRGWRGQPSFRVDNLQLDNSITTSGDCLAWAYAGLAYESASS